MATMLMQALYRCVAGIDVHKKMVMVCVLWEENGELKRQVRSFSTVYAELDHLKRWLKTLGVTHVAMESTGVYWKPVFYALENDFEVLLGNARHIKNVPGRKTDVKDCEWIASLLRCGLIRGSFVPPEPLRDLRDLTRYRVKLVQTLNREKNRVQKVLEDAQVKLSSVVSDVFGKTGSGLLEALLEGEEFDEETLKVLVVRNVRASLSEIQAALQGRVRDHHRFMIQAHLDMIAHTTEILQRVEQQIEACVEP